MFFAKPGKYKPCEIFSIDHLVLIIITIIGIIIALKNTLNKNKEQIRNIIKKCTIFIWILEIIIITFKIATGGIKNLNNYVPLYYCSMLLYAGIFSSFCKGKLQRVGDVFLATGGIIGGIVFLILPTTSLPTYPAFHMVSIHSFLFHGIMVYLGLLINKTNYIKIKATDIKYFSVLVLVICIIALIINNIFESNLMFISEDFPGTPLTILYKITGPFFTLVMILGQMFLPFYAVYGILKLNETIKRES